MDEFKYRIRRFLYAIMQAKLASREYILFLESRFDRLGETDEVGWWVNEYGFYTNPYLPTGDKVFDSIIKPAFRGLWYEARAHRLITNPWYTQSSSDWEEVV